ncbi:hypothetical protein Tco_1353008 [Tanacetum coccineum]
MAEGPVFKLFKGSCRSCIELEYHLEQHYLAVSDKLDWKNLKGDRIHQDFSNPLSLLTAHGRQYIPAKFFFNKDPEYLRSGNLEERKYTTSLTKTNATRVEDVQLGVEIYQTKLNLIQSQVLAYGVACKEFYTIFYKPKGVIYENMTGKRCLMREDEVCKFKDATIMKVWDELQY